MSLKPKENRSAPWSSRLDKEADRLGRGAQPFSNLPRVLLHTDWMMVVWIALHLSIVLGGAQGKYTPFECKHEKSSNLYVTLSIKVWETVIQNFAWSLMVFWWVPILLICLLWALLGAQVTGNLWAIMITFYWVMLTNSGIIKIQITAMHFTGEEVKRQSGKESHEKTQLKDRLMEIEHLQRQMVGLKGKVRHTPIHLTGVKNKASPDDGKKWKIITLSRHFLNA